MCDQSSHTLEQWVYALTTVINIFKFLLSKDRVILQQHFDFIPVDTVGQAQIIFTTNKDSRVKKKQNKTKTPPLRDSATDNKTFCLLQNLVSQICPEENLSPKQTNKGSL